MSKANVGGIASWLTLEECVAPVAAADKDTAKAREAHAPNSDGFCNLHYKTLVFFSGRFAGSSSDCEQSKNTPGGPDAARCG